MIDEIIRHVLPDDTNPYETQEIVKKITGVSYSMSQIRKIMHKHGMYWVKTGLPPHNQTPAVWARKRYACLAKARPASPRCGI